MKKYFIFILITFSLFAFGQSVEFSTGKVGKFKSTKRVTSDVDDTLDSFILSKEYKVRITSREKKHLCIFMYVTNGKRIKCDIFDEEVSQSKPFVHKTSESANIESRRHCVYYGMETRIQVNRPSNAKVDGCLFVFDVDTQKIISEKSVSTNQFLTEVKSKFSEKMQETVRRIKEELPFNEIWDTRKFR